MDDRDAEITRLRAELAAAEKDAEIERLRSAVAAVSPAVRGEVPGRGWVIAVLVVAAVCVSLFLFLVEEGRKLADREERVNFACAVASDNRGESLACREGFANAYRGDLSRERMANAAAQYVQDYRNQTR